MRCGTAVPSPLAEGRDPVPCTAGGAGAVGGADASTVGAAPGLRGVAWTWLAAVGGADDAEGVLFQVPQLIAMVQTQKKTYEEEEE